MKILHIITGWFNFLLTSQRNNSASGQRLNISLADYA